MVDFRSCLLYAFFQATNLEKEKVVCMVFIGEFGQCHGLLGHQSRESRDVSIQKSALV